MFDKTEWRPSYYLMMTNSVAEPEWKKDICRALDEGIPSFIWGKFFSLFSDYNNVYWLHGTQEGICTDRVPEAWWSDDITERVTLFGGSATPMLQIACYFEWNPIYLIGMDGNWRVPEGEEDPNHFMDGYCKGTKPTEERVNWWNYASCASHQWIRWVTEKRGIEIYNATPGSSIDAYPRVRLEDIL